MLRGFWTTLKSMFEKPETIPYPEKKRPVSGRFKGRHVLNRYENGLEKCIGCALCAAACPADAIFVEASENTDEARYSPGERYASTYEINMLRCIYCGYCDMVQAYHVFCFGHRISSNRLSSYSKALITTAIATAIQPTPPINAAPTYIPT